MAANRMTSGDVLQIAKRIFHWLNVRALLLAFKEYVSDTALQTQPNGGLDGAMPTCHFNVADLPRRRA